MESQASLQHFSSALGQIERGTVVSIAFGEIRVDIRSCKEPVAVRCLTCLHQGERQRGAVEAQFPKERPEDHGLPHQR
jgi:hypothetical protein